MNNKAKVVIAVIFLAVAGVAIANQFGLFGSGAAKRPTTQNAAQTGGTGDATTTTTDENATPPAGTLKKDNF
jgi:uncharacterized protein YdeI (BOF family)